MDKDRGIIQIQNEADVISANKYHQAWAGGSPAIKKEMEVLKRDIKGEEKSQPR